MTSERYLTSESPDSVTCEHLKLDWTKFRHKFLIVLLIRGLNLVIETDLDVRWRRGRKKSVSVSADIYIYHREYMNLSCPTQSFTLW